MSKCSVIKREQERALETVGDRQTDRHTDRQKDCFVCRVRGGSVRPKKIDKIDAGEVSDGAQVR